MIPDRPIPESYWVKPGQFLAGEYPGHYEAAQAAVRVTALVNAGFSLFVDLTCEGELQPYANLLAEETRAGRLAEHYRFPITDLSTPTIPQMRATLDVIDAGLADQRKVYLHCWGGVGRTGTVVGCYLVRHGMSGEQALQQLAQWWRGVPKSYRHARTPETMPQRAFVLNWPGL